MIFQDVWVGLDSTQQNAPELIEDVLNESYETIYGNWKYTDGTYCYIKLTVLNT